MLPPAILLEYYLEISKRVGILEEYEKMEKADKFLASSLKREITYVLLILSKIENGDTLEEIKDSPMSHVSKKMEKIRYYYKLL